MPEGRFRRALRRLTTDDETLEAEELRRRAESVGATSVSDCASRRKVSVLGTVQSTTVRPMAGAPAVEAELYDGTATLYVVWLGRREIGGIRTGVTLLVEGRAGLNRNRRTMFNPAYTIIPSRADD